VFGGSQYVMSCLQEMYWPNAQVLYHCLNTERFRPDPAVRRQMREALGFRDEYIVLFVAYFLKDKGGDIALRALAELPANVVLWIVGDGPEWENLQALARDLDLEPRVRFLSPRRHVELYMQAADCLICPSVWADAAGWVNLEGQACGLPVIASRTGGIPELVADGQTGYLFPPGDHRELADRVNRLLSDEPARLRMGQQARCLVLDRFSWESQVEHQLDVYRDNSSKN
jgi:glycosyltransferase involved in cell wall biosynthesis